MKKITLLMLFFSTVWGYSQTTNCTDVTEFFEDFDTYPTPLSNAPAVPNCWASTGTYGTAGISTMVNKDGSNRLELVANTQAAPPAMSYAVMPSISNLLAGNHRLRFTAYAYSAVSTTLNWLEIGYYDSTGNFVVGQTINNLPMTVATAQQYVVNPATWATAIPAGVKNLAFRNSNNTLIFFYIDNVTWEPIPQACAPDVKLPVAANQMTPNGGVLSWTAGGSETAWQYVYASTSVTNPYALTGTDVPGTSPTVSLSGLQPNTKYKVWIRSKCGNGSVGAWIGPSLFSTACGSGTEIFENFDGGVIPACWTKVGSVGSMGIGTSPIPAAPSGSNYLSISGGYATIPYTIAAMPPMSNAGAGNHRLKFKAMYTTGNSPVTPAKLVIGWLSDVTNPDSFHELQSVDDLATTVYNPYEFTFGALPQSPYLAFKNASAASCIMRIDDVIWEAIPTCPKLPAISADLVNSTTAQLSWTSGGVESAWQYVMTSGTETNPNNLSALNVLKPMIMDTAISATFTGLTPNTAYKVWLRSKCDDTTFGGWNGPLLVTTPCSPVTDFTQNFDASQSMPGCWSQAGKTGSVLVGSLGASKTPPSAPFILYMQSTAITGVAVVAMPGVSNINDGTRKLNFKYQSDTAGAKLDVGYLKNIADQNSFVSLLAAPLTCTTAVFQAASFDFGTYAVPDGIEVLAFKNTGDVAASINVDDVTWLPANGIATPVNDEPAGAISLTVGQNFGSNSIIETNAGSTTSAQASPGCGAYNGSDVWNKAVVPASGNITFEINTITGGLTNTAGAVYSGPLSSLTLISCDDSSSTAGNNNPKISLSGRTPNEVLYFRVWANGGTAFGSFYASAYDSTAPHLGTDTFETNNFAYYPNPVRDMLNLSLNQEITNVVVLNLLGQEVMNQSANGNEVKMDMSGLSRGAYLVKVISNNQSKTIKVIKE